MEARTIGVFALGFSTGALSLCVLLWSGGALRSAAESPRSPLTQRTPPPANEPVTAVTAPSFLTVPVEGVDVHQLVDSFKDVRDGRQHEALDIPAARGTPVLAVAEGNVVKLYHSNQGGTTVYQFDNSRTYCYYYAHLDRYAAGLKEGTLLRQGEVLGYVGSTGNASAEAPHLHFAVFRLGPEKKWWKGEALDPLPLFKKG